jgi:hypothetical protein
MRHFLMEDKVLQQQRPARTGTQRIFILGIRLPRRRRAPSVYYRFPDEQK